MAKPKKHRTFFVRIKPFNKKRGFLMRNYMTGGVRFTTRWKEVSARKARELESKIQPHDPEAEIPLFDIKTKAEAEAIEEKERDDQGKPSSRVKEAELVPDSKFRDDRPSLDEETGEVVSNVEPGEIVGDEDAPVDANKDQSEEPAEAVPAPSLRSDRATARRE